MILSYATLAAIVIHSIVFSNLVLSQAVKPLTRPIVSFCGGYLHACAAFDNKRMKCWGLKSSWGLSSLSDYLGDEITEIGIAIPYIDIGTGIGVEQVSCGYNHVCARLDSGDIKCIGQNDKLQIGIGLKTPTVIGAINGYIGSNLPIVNLGSGLQVLDIATGQFHSCALLTGNKVKCFGFNSFGQLGYGDIKDKGQSSSEMGSNLNFVDLGTGVEVASIHSSSSANHNCVILLKPTSDAQRVKCWGRGDYYQLGYGINNNKGDQANEMGDNLTLVDFGSESRVIRLSLGVWHTCTLLFNNILKCYGNAQYGQLGSGSGAFITSTGDLMPSVQTDPGYTTKLISTGSYHNCIVYDDNITMKCFGYNDRGQLGIGNTLVKGNSPTTLIPSYPTVDLGTGALKISSIHSGFYFNCVIFEDSSVKCFGWNIYGMFAIGSTGIVGDSPGQMGTNLAYSVLFSESVAPTTNPTKPPTGNPTPPTSTPTNIPTKKPTLAPTTDPTRRPTSNPKVVPTSSPTKNPSHHPTSSPTRSCEYYSAKLCKYDIKCMWKKVDGVKKCVTFDCTSLNKGKCGKQRARCKWNSGTTSCVSKTQ